MRCHRWILFGTMLLAPASAQAACQPSFVQTTTGVTVRPSFQEGQQTREQIDLRLRNDGDAACSARLVVGRVIAAGSEQIPDYVLTGPSGQINVLAAQVAGGQAGSVSLIEIPAGGQIIVRHELRLEMGWGDRAGDYFDELLFTLLPADDQVELASARVRVHFDIPAIALIRFAGSGHRGAARVEMGSLSPYATTRSPPFAIRVLSTSPYRMQLQSQNAGALVRIGATDRVPYRLAVGSAALNLSGSGDGITVNRHTSRTGDVHPVSISIEPDPLRHAGQYSDHVTVSVTPL